MTCQRYGREGILLVERGERDPHREMCDDCRRAHAARGELVAALPEVGAARAGDPGWQVRVWSRIAAEETARARRSYWIGGGLLAACAALAICVLGLVHRERPRSAEHPVLAASDRGDGAAARTGQVAAPAAVASVDDPAGARDGRPRIEIVSGPLAKRSTSARVGDRVRISVGPGGEVRVYRAGKLVLRCPAAQRSGGCAPDAQGLIADAELATAGDYQLVLIHAKVAASGTLDDDLAAVVAAGGDYKVTDLSVR